MEDSSSLIEIRKNKIKEIREMKIDPFPYRYDVTEYSTGDNRGIRFVF